MRTRITALLALTAGLLPSLAASAQAPPVSHPALPNHPVRPQGGPRPRHIVNVGEEFDGATITLPYGQELVVSLSANPSTPYAWNLVADPKSPLHPVGPADYTPTPHEPHLVGSGGTDHFAFTVAKPFPVRRTVLLRLRYQPLGEKNPNAGHLWQIKVVIPRTRAGATP